MTHSLIFPFLVLNLVHQMFYTSLCCKWPRKLSHFCKMARTSKAVGPRWFIQS